ncbi:MAG: hypothetical protein ACK40G_13855 [Cytophagaceae bacterium]
MTSKKKPGIKRGSPAKKTARALTGSPGVRRGRVFIAKKKVVGTITVEFQPLKNGKVQMEASEWEKIQQHIKDLKSETVIKRISSLKRRSPNEVQFIPAESTSQEDFEKALDAVSGLWKDRDIDLKKLRQAAWKGRGV